jgi:hypothetical protein
MAKDKGQVRRVLQILSPEDQETLAILHDAPRMEELLRRQETLAEVKAAGLAGGVVTPVAGSQLAPQSLPGLCMFPAAVDELAGLPAMVRDTLLRHHLPALLATPQEGLALTQLLQGLWVSICAVDSIDYRVVYEPDPQSNGLTILMVGDWASLEERLEGEGDLEANRRAIDRREADHNC